MFIHRLDHNFVSYLFFFSIAVRQAAGICLKDILATQCGIEFGEMYKSKRDPLLAYLNPFRSAKKRASPSYWQNLFMDTFEFNCTLNICELLNH